MAYQYVTVNGQRVEKNAAAALARLAVAFHQRWGLYLWVTSGVRTRTEQTYLYNGWIKRLPDFNLAAPPGKSDHEEDGPSGPRAFDLCDSGLDAGVTVIGSARSNWLAENAPKYGIIPDGHTFTPEEGWHYKYVGQLATSPASSNPFGIATAQGLQKVARLYGYAGAIDDQFGPGSMAGFAQFLRQNWGYVGNDVLGVVMWAAIARWLRARWGYVGNDVPGAIMRAALTRADLANRQQL